MQKKGESKARNWVSAIFWYNADNSTPTPSLSAEEEKKDRKTTVRLEKRHLRQSRRFQNATLWPSLQRWQSVAGYRLHTKILSY